MIDNIDSINLSINLSKFCPSIYVFCLLSPISISVSNLEQVDTFIQIK